MSSIRQVARPECVLETDVSLDLHAERLAIGKANDLTEAQPGLALDRSNRFGHDKPQVGCACSGHCGVSLEVLSCPDR
jgi:hypothetical protein